MNVFELECKYTPVLVVPLVNKIFEMPFSLHNWHSLFSDSLSCHRYCQIIDFLPTWLLTSTKFGFGELIFNFSQIYILRQNGPNKMFVFVALSLLFRIILASNLFINFSLSNNCQSFIIILNKLKI